MNQRKKSEVRSEKKEIQHVNICGIQNRTMAKVPALNTYIRKDKWSQINTLSFQFKRGEKEEPLHTYQNIQILKEEQYHVGEYVEELELS